MEDADRFGIRKNRLTIKCRSADTTPRAHETISQRWVFFIEAAKTGLILDRSKNHENENPKLKKITENRSEKNSMCRRFSEFLQQKIMTIQSKM